ncbi:MAG: hypothetical protein AEth_01380 [Candidatus Argoarchaeum ethanivorans]|uniref:Uncharacterized protein n=1 Tax=Candidatus Argoarchaeum ethanivorans TaxID=2608793 RepID=A0A8B3S0E5_9EURY|nr:MAG: hypothetical protein AEth_01380 [Candidatus Argoarchaeum ethanivorans]
MILEKKGPIICTVLIIAAMMILGMGCTDIDSKTPVEKPLETPVKTAPETPVKTTPVPTPKPTPKPTTVVAAPQPIKCDLCHVDSGTLLPHKEGGKYCFKCHGSDVHPIHIGTGTVNLKCESCHGPATDLSIPKAEAGHVTCEKCHAAPPDSFQPSNGDIVEIHLSRNVYCTKCHGSDVYKLHETVLGTSK